ncbi:hypothetical protein Tco_1529983, partial [Tanacetum coccineum]
CTLANSAQEAEALENVKRVEQHLLDEDVNKIDPGSQKGSLEAVEIAEYVAINEEEEETVEAELIQRKGKGSLDIRDTPLATPTRPPRTESLSSVKDQLKELTASKLSSSKVSSSKTTLSHSRHLKGFFSDVITLETFTPSPTYLPPPLHLHYYLSVSLRGTADWGIPVKTCFIL